MDVLGIGAWTSPGAACLVRDGRIVAAAREDRYTRRPEDPDFPRFHITSPVFTARDIANRMAREAEGQPVRDHAWTRNARAARMAAELWGEKTEA